MTLPTASNRAYPQQIEICLSTPQIRLLSLSGAAVSGMCAGFFPARYWWPIGLISAAASLYHGNRAILLLTKKREEEAKMEALLTIAHGVAAFSWWHFSQSGNDFRNDFHEFAERFRDHRRG